MLSNLYDLLSTFPFRSISEGDLECGGDFFPSEREVAADLLYDLSQYLPRQHGAAWPFEAGDECGLGLDRQPPIPCGECFGTAGQPGDFGDVPSGFGWIRAQGDEGFFENGGDGHEGLGLPE
jgi:hypothetical protein